jgi:hypothetical protein
MRPSEREELANPHALIRVGKLYKRAPALYPQAFINNR